MPTANRSTSVSATSLGATVSGYLEAVVSQAQATMKRVRLRIPGPVSMRTQFLAGTIQLDRSCWLRLLPQELRWSLVTGLPSARASLSPRLAKESATPSLSSQLNRSGRPERFNWIGRAGCVFFRKSFVARSLRAFNRPAPRSRLVLRKNPPGHPFPPN